MLLLDTVQGISFIIELDKEYDYFEIIPSLEYTFRKRFFLRCRKHFNKYQVIVIPHEDTRDRFIKSDFYSAKRKEINEFEQKRKNLTDQEEDVEFDRLYNNRLLDIVPIELTEDEKLLIQNIKSYLGAKVKNNYWVDDTDYY